MEEQEPNANIEQRFIAQVKDRVGEMRDVALFVIIQYSSTGTVSLYRIEMEQEQKSRFGRVTRARASEYGNWQLHWTVATQDTTFSTR